MSRKHERIKLRKGDTVVVVSGVDRGKQGKILRVLPKKDRVIIEKVRLVKRHQKPTRENPQGGIVEKEASIHLSNVMLLDPEQDRPTRVGIRVLDDGMRRRYARRSGAVIES